MRTRTLAAAALTAVALLGTGGAAAAHDHGHDGTRTGCGPALQALQDTAYAHNLQSPLLTDECEPLSPENVVLAPR